MKAVMPFCFFRLLPEGMPQQALGAGGRGAYKIAQAIKKGGIRPRKASGRVFRGYCISLSKDTPPAVLGEVKGFRCRFRAKRDGLQHQKNAACNGKSLVYGGGVSDAGDRAFSAS